MLSVERYEAIIKELEQRKTVRVSDLSKLLNITEKTIRIDLENLEQKGVLKRIHGGAILEDSTGKLLPIEKRQSAQNEVKRAIAMEAYQQIKPNETILMDGGSTTLELCKLLGAFPVTIITNDLKIANELQTKENVQLMVLGGTRIQHSSSLMGAQAVDLLKKIRVNHLFFGTTGVSFEYGLTVFNSLHADWKKQIIGAADYVTLVADSSKFDKVALIQFAEIEEVNEIITDSNLTDDIRNQLEHYDITLKIANI